MTSSLFAQEAAKSDDVSELEKTNSVPKLLSGIWQGSDRIVRFTNTDDGFYCVLRTFYGWYDDRAAESSSLASAVKRDSNDTTSSEPEVISVTYSTLAENKAGTAGAYELNVLYPKEKKNVVIPVAVIDGKLYLKFIVPSVSNASTGGITTAGSSDGEYWRSQGTASGITVSKPREAKELVSYYFSGTSIYHIRYWLSEMPYTKEQATFNDGEKKYTVDKYIRAGGNVYTCTTGRSTEIRNIEKSATALTSITYDSEKSIGVFGIPYLIKVPGNGTNEQLAGIVAENNKRRHPAPKPLFPPSDINFHWKEISELEKYNPWTWNRRNIDLGK